MTPTMTPDERAYIMARLPVHLKGLPEFIQWRCSRWFVR